MSSLTPLPSARWPSTAHPVPSDLPHAAGRQLFSSVLFSRRRCWITAAAALNTGCCLLRLAICLLAALARPF
jgi:hypothetical protein